MSKAYIINPINKSSKFFKPSAQHNLIFSLFFRYLETLYEEISPLETKDIRKLTGCMKPCKYKKYTFIGEAQTTSFQSQHYSLSLWAVSKDTWVETEVDFSEKLKQSRVILQNPFLTDFILTPQSRYFLGAHLSSLVPSCWDWWHTWRLPWIFLHCSLGWNSTSYSMYAFDLFLLECKGLKDMYLISF